MVAQSLMGQPALTVRPCFRLASRSISGVSVGVKNRCQSGVSVKGLELNPSVKGFSSNPFLRIHRGYHM